MWTFAEGGKRFSGHGVARLFYSELLDFGNLQSLVGSPEHHFGTIQGVLGSSWAPLCYKKSPAMHAEVVQRTVADAHGETLEGPQVDL